MSLSDENLKDNVDVIDTIINEDILGSGGNPIARTIENLVESIQKVKDNLHNRDKYACLLCRYPKIYNEQLEVLATVFRDFPDYRTMLQELFSEFAYNSKVKLGTE